MKLEYQYKLEYEDGGTSHIVEDGIPSLREALRKAKKLCNDLSPEMTVRVLRSMFVRHNSGLIETVDTDRVIWEELREVRMHQRRGHYQNQRPRLSR